MIIDDETRLRETICKLLSHADHDARDAQDGMEELEKVKLFIPELNLYGNMIPFLDGYRFMEKYTVYDYSNIPVIFLTARM